MALTRSDRLAAVLVVLASVFLLVGVLAAYLRDNVLDAGEFAERGAATLDDPEVRAVLADTAVETLVEAQPDLLRVRPLLLAATTFAVDTDTVADIVRFGLVETHQTLLGGDADNVTIRLADLLLIVNAQVRVLEPELAAELPEDLTDTLVTVVSRDRSADAIAAANDVREAAFVFPLLALAGYAAAVLFSASRRRALVPIGTGVAVVGGLLVIAEQLGRSAVDRSFEGAGVAIWDAYAGELTGWGLVLVAVGAAVAAGASAMLRPMTVESVIETGRAVLSWGLDTRFGTAVRVAGTLLLAVWLLVDPLGAVAAVVRIVGLVLLAVTVAQILAALGSGQRTEETTVVRSRFAVWGVAAAVLLGLTGVLGLLVVRSIGSGADVVTGAGCNGSVLLCERRLDEIVIAATHNSNSSAADGYLVANHSRGITAQLDAGYRGLLLDTWYGIEGTLGIVVTDRAPLTEEQRADISAELGADAVAAAEALQDRQRELGGTPDFFLCHSLCEIGSTRLDEALLDLGRWLERNPREVIVLFIQDELTPADTEAAFAAAGLEDLLHVQSLDDPFPTLAEMIDDDRRVFVMAENDPGDVSWYHDGFAFTQDTPFSFSTVDEFSCVENRGSPGSPLFLMNHFLTPVDPRATDEANGAELIVERARECEEERGERVTMIAVDFFSRGDVLDAIDELNGVERE